ncbi:hypothetical protein VA7868_03687 [Vibrio aerogenes CECT 7868]|uniref:Spore coat protein U domain-containing protein n=1 Tax=Vibrio aerogenes CECT 7868 TaxID=1216006 RepID=A0A1M6B2A5_9VIBR|nr:hypothetical protein [Vibrio aerogenes]SHI42603.1 hypothetical protein VA7868_03687 [Vibrio aerogenes CECT 7868]
MKFIQFAAPLLLLPSLAFANSSTSVTVGLPDTNCINEAITLATIRLSLNLTDLNGSSANTNTIGISAYDQYGHTLKGYGSISINGKYTKTFEKNFEFASCDEVPKYLVIKNAQGATHPVLATGYITVREESNGMDFYPVPLNINQGNAF